MHNSKNTPPLYTMQKELLDFSIYSDEERKAHVEHILSGLGRAPTAKELDLSPTTFCSARAPMVRLWWIRA